MAAVTKPTVKKVETRQPLGRRPNVGRQLKEPPVLDRHGRVEFVREVFRKSLYAFIVECLGYDKLYDPHEEWCNGIQRFYLDYEARRPGYSKRALRLMPRGTFKSTIFTVGFVLWMLARDPDLRILLYSGKEGNAKNFLHEIKKHITMNARFRSCFGKWEQAADRWTTTDIIIGPRKRARKEPSIAAIGKGSEITSMHFDIAIVDDLVTRDDRDSAAARDESRRALQDLESIMDHDSLVSAIGTHWHYADAYTWIRKELNPKLVSEGKQPWEVFVETPYEADGVTERFSRILPDLEELKIKRGLVEYYANYMNNPLPPDTQLFPEGALTYFDFDVEAYAECIKYAYWDPASTERGAGRDPDYHAIPIIARTGEFFDVIDVWLKQDKPSAGYAMAEALAKSYRLMHLRVETNHLPDAADNLEKAFRAARIGTAVSGEKATGSKMARVQSIEPLTSAGRIRFRRDWRECSSSYRLLMEQLTMYPVASHDDGPDALAGCYQLAAWATGGEPVEVAVKEGDDEAGSEFIESIFTRYSR